MKQEIKNLDDKVIKEVELDKSIFGINVKDEIIHIKNDIKNLPS